MSEKTPAQKFAESYRGKICPYLSIAGMRRDTGSLVGTSGAALGNPEDEVIGCQGPSCMLFVPVADENGVPCSGACALTLMPTAVSQVSATLSAIASALLKK